MEILFKIVEFYESIKCKDLFRESIYSDESWHKISELIANKNTEFIKLIELSTLRNDFGYKAIEIILNKLSIIHQDLSFDLLNKNIPRVENTPLFKFKIEFNSSYLTIVLSQMAIIEGISNLYMYLDLHFSKEINLGKRLMPYSYCPAYIDEKGYISHIYCKFLNDDFLKDELYNHNEYWVKKIDEFLHMLPDEIKICLPINYKSNLSNIHSNQFDIEDPLLNLQNELNILGVNYCNENGLNKILNKLKDNGIIITPEGSTSSESMDGFSMDRSLNNEKYSNPTKSQVSPLFRLERNFIKNAENDYVKDLYLSLKDYFGLISKETKLSHFRNLFWNSELINKIVVTDSKKMLAIIKFLKSEKIITPHHHYMVKMCDHFIEPNNKEITPKSLRGSKCKLTYKEGKQLTNLFKTANS